MILEVGLTYNLGSKIIGRSSVDFDLVFPFFDLLKSLCPLQLN